MLKCNMCGFENKIDETCANCGSTIRRYVKAIPLCGPIDVPIIKRELESGNVLIINIVPFLLRNGRVMDDHLLELKTAIEELMKYAISIDGDGARIGNERLILAPFPIRIWNSHLRERMDNLSQEKEIGK